MNATDDDGGSSLRASRAGSVGLGTAPLKG